jgi:rRNA-processing protein FCF1
MIKPSPEDLRAAAIWLDSNEGDAAERGPLLRVAHWLEVQAEAQELREAAREAGVPVAQLRKRLAAMTPSGAS